MSSFLNELLPVHGYGYMYICLYVYMCVCSDVNECEELNGGCQQTCVNTRGSHHCECSEGFRMHADGRTCIGKYLAEVFITFVVTILKVLPLLPTHCIFPH